MEIRHRLVAGKLRVDLQGALGNETAGQFVDFVSESLREGRDQIHVSLAEISYLSSAGMSALVTARRKTIAVGGHFSITECSSQAEKVLRLTKLLAVLQQADSPSGSITHGADHVGTQSVLHERNGFQFEVTALDCDSVGTSLETIGRVDLQATGHVTASMTTVDCQKNRVAIGLGSLRREVDTTGEVMSVFGAVCQSSTTYSRPPDYSVAEGEFTPEVNFCYGLQCGDNFSHSIHFRADEDAERPYIGLSSLVNGVMEISGQSQSAFVMVAECEGLVGAQWRRSNQVVVEDDGGEVNEPSIFSFPGIKNWISYNPEPTYQRCLAVICGIACQESSQDFDQIKPFVRPMDSESRCHSHFHAAVFPYQPIRREVIDPHAFILELFRQGAIMDVQHLLRDDRDLRGPGESTFRRGICWISPVQNICQWEMQS
jgi:anti-anti-sigma factor